MTERPYVLLSCAMSVDGYIDDTGPRRLVLSSAEDLDRVDGERAGSDAVLVGAGTVRRDDPALRLRSAARREERVARGLPGDPLRVTLTRTGNLDPGARFFAGGSALVYCSTGAIEGLRERLGDLATVVDAGEPPDLRWVLGDLRARGVRRLMVEGGGSVHTQLLTGDLADELQLVVAPFFVGDPLAPRFVGAGAFPRHAGSRMALAETRQLGDVVLLRYLLRSSPVPSPEGGAGEEDRRWLRVAIDLSRRSPPADTAFSVGAVIVDAAGAVVAEGYSREVDARVHAEESALAKVGPGDPRLPGATMYSSLEPCSVRKSRPRSCASLILAAGIRRVVFALREPALFVEGRGAEVLRAAGATVVEIPELAAEVRAVNRHLLQ